MGTDDRAHLYKWLMFLTNTIQPDFMTFYYPDKHTTDESGIAADLLLLMLTHWGPAPDESTGEPAGHPSLRRPGLGATVGTTRHGRGRNRSPLLTLERPLEPTAEVE